MKSKPTRNPRKFWKTGCLAVSLPAATLLPAAEPAASTVATPAASDQVVTLDPIQVTGSYLPFAADAVAIPVITISSDQVNSASSRSNIGDALRRRIPQLSGNSNLGTSNANVGSGSTNGGTQLALRNSATLVLINGRRMAAAPVGASGGFVFTDVNLVPFAAVKSIEILPDGASAIYGTDAVSGVINVLMKDDYQGFEVGGRYAWTDNTGNAIERSVYAVGGVTDGKTKITIAAEFANQDPVLNYERPYSAETYGTVTFAGSVNIGGDYYLLDSSLNAPTVVGGGQSAADLVAGGIYGGPNTSGPQSLNFNLSRYVTQIIANERSGVTSAFSHEFNDRLKLFGDILVSKTSTASQINAQPISLLFDPGQNGNPFDEEVRGRNRFVEYPRAYNTETEAYRGVLGFEGKLTDTWKWSVAGNYSRADQSYRNPGVVNFDKLTAAVDSGLINFFAREQAPGAVESSGAIGTAYGNFKSTLGGADVKFYGTLATLPAGDLDLAVGAETRREVLEANADPLSQPDSSGNIGWLGATTLQPFSASRDIHSVFSEVRIPLLKDAPGAHYLEVSAAGRLEMYSDNDDPVVPKLTFRYLPFSDAFALRGTYSESFVAPTLYEVNGPDNIGFSSPGDLTPSDGSDVVGSYQSNSRSVSNPDLTPAESQNYTLGIVISPASIKGLKVSVDYFRIKQEGLVDRVPDIDILQDVETRGAASRYAGLVKLNSFDGDAITAPGQLSGVPDDVYLTNPLANLSSVDIQGFDVAGTYVLDTNGAGVFTFNTNVGIYISYETAILPGDEAENYAGQSSYLNGTLPDCQAYTSIDYTISDYSFMVGWRYIPGLDGYEDDSKIKSFNSIDTAVSYEVPKGVRFLSGMKVTFGVNNVFNRFGPLDYTVNTDSNVDTGTYGAIGRQFFVDVSYKF
jgi:iron complex outermembrane receptor protein